MTNEELRALADEARLGRASGNLFMVVARTEVPRLLDENAALRKALMDLGWNERSGRCWCPSSPEFTGYHGQRCLAARAALAEVPA